MIVECKNCGAPLDIKAGAKTTKCCYCDVTNRTDQLHTIAPVTPNRWQQPRTWTVPAHMPAPTNQLLRLSKRIIGLTAIVPLLVGLFGAGSGTFVMLGGSSYIKVSTWDGKETLICKPNETLKIEGVKAKVKEGPVIEAMANCKLTIIDSKLSGEVGLKLHQNAQVNISGSTLRGTQAAMQTGSNAKLEIRGGQFTSDKVGIEAGLNSKLLLQGVTITAPTGISAGTNAKLTLRDCHIDASDVGIKANLNLKVDMDDGAIKGKVGIAAQTNPKLSFTSSTLTLSSIGIKAGHNLELWLKGGSKIDAGSIAVKADLNAKLYLEEGSLSSKGTALSARHNAVLECGSGSEVRAQIAISAEYNARLDIKGCKFSGQRKLGRNAKISE